MLAAQSQVGVVVLVGYHRIRDRLRRQHRGLRTGVLSKRTAIVAAPVIGGAVTKVRQIPLATLLFGRFTSQRDVNGVRGDHPQLTDEDFQVEP